ncbi:MAG: S-layer homology domain-containing protein [Oscillospiraceae bacterium]|nr:S-layer homology domain-containing protein [Oscillospiraceae bacterium]
MLRKLLAALLVWSLCLCAIPFSTAAEPIHKLHEEELEVLRIVNRERLKEELPPLTSTPVLQEGGGIRAAELEELPSHTRPNGSSWFSILGELDLPAYYRVGENVAAGQIHAVDVMQAWMNSTTHRMNILDPLFVHLGVGYHYSAASTYGTHWAQLFFTSYHCEYTSMELILMEQEPVALGTTAEQLPLVAQLQCETCGASYLPILEEYCSGYDPQLKGRQTIEVSCLGFTADISVVVDSEQEDTPQNPTGQFIDIAADSWYAPSVEYMVTCGLMNGVGNNRFNPSGSVTRAMLVTILYRAAGSPSVEGILNPFTDVPNAWYRDAVVWAASQGVVNGVSKDRFNPNGAITREQIATILYRYEGVGDIEVDLDAFTDGSTVSGYAQQPMTWATQKGLINGVGSGKLAPANTATRAQIATILARYLQQ